MDATGSHESNRAYYDAFSEGYEDHRGENDPGGYHDLLDELEADFVERFGRGRDVLEIGCGTGLVLSRIARFARSVRGLDLSPGMLERARARGLSVVEGSATELPFPHSSFDVTCSFKVLAHIPDIRIALSEMARVTRPGGFLIAEFYNPVSLRGLAKTLAPHGKVAAAAHEGHVYTRFDSPLSVSKLLPPGCDVVDSRGVRIATPTAKVMRHPLGRRLFGAAERRLCDSPLKYFGGFWIVAAQKRA
ncbi:MAG: class I SAM-dependent methyltransferase [Myxococcales bacterium]|nr:class I SAM-dependent methyltransferase [Myxococcales bacterium]